MTYLKKLGATVGVTGALILVVGGWAGGAEAATGNSPAVDVQAAIAEAFGDTERADSVLWAAIPTPTTLQPTLQQRSGRGGGRRVAQPRRGGARVLPPRGRGGRTVVLRGGYYYSPYYYGLGYPYGYGYPYYGGGYYGYYGGSYPYAGSVRLKIKPRAAEVLVDGYYVGTVDDFDGTFQSLKLEPGPASIEVRAPGFEALRLDVRVLAGRKITYEENMRAGDPGQAPPPSAARRPSPRVLTRGPPWAGRFHEIAAPSPNHRPDTTGSLRRSVGCVSGSSHVTLRSSSKATSSARSMISMAAGGCRSRAGRRASRSGPMATSRCRSRSGFCRTRRSPTRAI